MGRRSNGRGRRSRKTRPVHIGGGRIGGEPDRGVGTLLGRPQDRVHQAVEPRQRRGDAGRVRPARVHGVEDDLVGGDAPRPLPYERDLGALGVRVGARAFERCRPPTGGRRVGVAGRTSRPRSRRPRARQSVERSKGRSPAIRVNGPRTRVAKVASNPSGLSIRSGKMAPALSMTTSSRGSVPRTRVTACRTEVSEAMSATTVAKRSSPWVRIRSSRTAVSRSRSRPTRTMRAPRPASASVAARPRPEVGPVIRTVWPRNASAGGGVHPKRRRRTEYPMAEKLGTTAISSASSRSCWMFIVPRDARTRPKGIGRVRCRPSTTLRPAPRGWWRDAERSARRR